MNSMSFPDLGFSLEGMMLQLKLQYFGHLMRSVDSLEKTLINKQLIGADCAAENAMIKQLTGTDQSVGRC